MKIIKLFLLNALLLLSACSANYTTPPSGVSLVGITDSDIEEVMARQPFAAFPAHVAVIRIQASDYTTLTNSSYGSGNYSVVTTRDIESEDSFERMSEWPSMAALAPIGRLLLPTELQTMHDIRQAAAHLKADVIFAYTVDTDFHINDQSQGPLSLISLGLLKKNRVHINSTISGMIIDVRSGFIYGVSEGSAKEEQKANLWNEESVIDAARLRTEKKGFETFLDESEKLWTNILRQYAN